MGHFKMSSVLAQRENARVAVTFCEMEGNREGTLEAGCSGNIQTPVNPHTFQSPMEKYLQARPAGEGTQP